MLDSLAFLYFRPFGLHVRRGSHEKNMIADKVRFGRRHDVLPFFRRFFLVPGCRRKGLCLRRSGGLVLNLRVFDLRLIAVICCFRLHLLLLLCDVELNLPGQRLCLGLEPLQLLLFGPYGCDLLLEGRNVAGELLFLFLVGRH